MIRAVLRAPAPALSAVAGAVNPCAPHVGRVAADLTHTLLAIASGLCLSAPELGEPMRLLAIHDPLASSADSDAVLPVVLANPRLIQAEGARLAREACRCAPGITADVTRATRATVTGEWVGSGQPHTVQLCDRGARAVQHALDHLDGRFFLERVAGSRALHLA